jgi:hypothetical protein
MKASLVLDGGAWLILFAVLIHDTDRDFIKWIVASVGWPLVYGFSLVMIRGIGWLAQSVDESSLYGPAKDMQLKMLRGPFLLWLNAAAILLPAPVIVVATLGMLGILKPPPNP